MDVDRRRVVRRGPSESNLTPVEWKRVADATTIAALQVPGADGTKVDVFKSSVAVAREVGDFLARRL